MGLSLGLSVSFPFLPPFAPLSFHHHQPVAGSLRARLCTGTCVGTRARQNLFPTSRQGVVDLGAKLPDKIKFHFAEGVSGQSSSQVASGQSDYLVNQFCR